MRYSYIFVYDDDFDEKSKIIDFIDDIPEVLNWKVELPNSMYLVSELTAKELFDKIKPYSDKGKFLVSETPGNKQGWLARSSWKMLNEKHLPGEE